MVRMVSNDLGFESFRMAAQCGVSHMAAEAAVEILAAREGQRAGTMAASLCK